jgi:predicted RecA/RadA family phage recombinase
MARNERGTAALQDHFSAAVPAATASGAPVVVLTDVPAVTQTKEGEGGNIAGRATVTTVGVHTLSTTDAVAAEGTKVYLTSGGVLTTTVGTNVLFGRTVHSAEGPGGTTGAGAGTVHVRLAKV